jgi:TniQ protein
MTRLPLVVDLHADETPASFVSRLASLNGTGAHGLCRDARLVFQHVVDGDANTLRAVAAMGLADPDALQANAFVRTAKLRWDWRGHDLHRAALRGRRVTICPACALADIAARPDLPPAAAVYGRILWRIDAVRTCLVHKTPLVPTGTGHGAMHDFAYHIAMVLPRLAKLADVEPQEPTAFETYVAARLDGLTASPLLDPMPLDQAVRLVETAGAVEQWGPKINLNTLSDASRRIAGARGFDAIATGPKAFADLLQRLQGKRSRHRQDGAGAVFGPLNYLLYATRDRTEYGAIQSVARTYVADNFVAELIPGATATRRLHSIHTLAKASGIHPAPLRKRLRAAGLVTEAQMANSDHNVRIDAAAAEKVAQEAAGLLSRAAAMDHIGAPRSQMDVLIASGLLTPRWELGAFGGRDGYAAADLDTFLGSLAANAEPIGKTSKGFCTIPTAARHACRSAAEIVRLILDGKLATRTCPARAATWASSST